MHLCAIFNCAAFRVDTYPRMFLNVLECEYLFQVAMNLLLEVMQASNLGSLRARPVGLDF